MLRSAQLVPSRLPTDPNRFDGRLSIFIWQPSSLVETSLSQLAANLRAAAPNVNAVIVRAATGAGWPGRSERGKPNLAISGLSDLQRWVRELTARGLEVHAWALVSGGLPTQELDRLTAIAQHSGVSSLLLHLAPPSGLGLRAERRGGFVGSAPVAAALARGLRERVGPGFHLGLVFDPRPGQPEAVFLQRCWFPEIDSLHPLVFHHEFGQTPREALRDTYTALQSWGKPIYPVLQAYGLPAREVGDALAAAADEHQAPGVSLFRYGAGSGQGLNRAELGAVAARWPATRPVIAAHGVSRNGGTPGTASLPSLTIIDPDDERNGLFNIGYYESGAAAGWTRDHDSNGRARLWRNASYNRQTLYVGYSPRLSGRGVYTLEVFVPRNHAYIRDAHYFIVDYPRGVRRESLAVLDQSPHSDVWVPLKAALVNGAPADPPLAEFALDPAFPDSGRVNVADITFLDPAQRPGGRYEISFGAVRWRPYTPPPPAPPPATAVGFDSPVGTPAERAGAFADGRQLFNHYAVWCGQWYDANPIGSRYWLGNRWAVHTGGDLNLSGPGGVLADKDAPVYAVADGRVISAGFVSTGWKNIIIIEHPVPGEDRVIYARYAHVTAMRVQANDLVTRGRQICAIGQYAPNNYHLHFDLSFNPILKTQPGHWPGDNLPLVRQVYEDPKAFIKQHHVIR
ncbi:MAG: M23 family metallopeptidase [Anaerolineales bacterium]|nr:M23 family metallopeptidase [Anaerolineales bacterium]